VRGSTDAASELRKLMRSWFLCVFACINVAPFSQPANAQDTRVSIESRSKGRGSADRSAADRSSANIRVNSELVLIPVTVVDSMNRLVTGLEKQHFKLYEDKVEQVITHFASEDTPLSVGFLFDCSGSMGDKLKKSREAVAQLLKTANPDDEFFLVEFNDHAEIVVGLTKQSEEIQNRLTFTQSKGQTALLDAIILSMNEMRKARNPRKALVIISDGGDNSSRYTISEVKNRVREADVQIYAIGILELFADRGRTPEELVGPELLRGIAEQTGGRLFEAANLNQLPDIASKIGAALRNEYVLGYAPSTVRSDGKYHHVRLKLVRPKGWPSLQAYWRLGYYAPAQ
jgi:Ca-activated chloride channel family protein